MYIDDSSQKTEDPYHLVSPFSDRPHLLERPFTYSDDDVVVPSYVGLFTPCDKSLQIEERGIQESIVIRMDDRTAFSLLSIILQGTYYQIDERGYELLRQDPGLIPVANDGWKRLLCICTRHSPEQVIKDIDLSNVALKLLNRYPHLVRQRNDDGTTLLQSALMRDQPSKEVIQLLLELYPEAVHYKDPHYGTPLHSACRTRASKEVIELLLERHPDAIHEKDESEWTPLHCACASSPPPKEIIEVLLQKYPEALQNKDYFGSTPLHTALRNNPSKEVIALMLETHPKTLQDKDERGNTPIFHALYIPKEVFTSYCSLSFVPSKEVIELLLEKHRQTSEEIDGFGSALLLAGLRCRNSKEVIKMVIDRYPDAMRNKDGESLLRCSCSSGAPEDVMEVLLNERNDFKGTTWVP